MGVAEQIKEHVRYNQELGVPVAVVAVVITRDLVDGLNTYTTCCSTLPSEIRLTAAEMIRESALKSIKQT